MFYIRIGFRNIVKNFRRSLLTMLSIIIGMVACLLTHGFFNWNINELKEAMIHNGIGHIQLYAVGFGKNGTDDPYRYLIQDARPIVKELRRIPGVELVTTRMNYSGLISTGDQSTVTMGEAGEPQNEAKFKSNLKLIQGTKLSPDQSNDIIIGAGLADKLAAKIGDSLTLMGNMQGGGINAVDLEVVGITRSGAAELDNTATVTSLRVVQNLLGIGHSVQRIVVLLHQTRQIPEVLPSIERVARKYHLEYRSWENLAELYHSLKLMYDAVFYIIILIVLAIVIFTISNTVNMNLNERFREIGTIRALGTCRSQVALIFIAESGLMGLLGGFIGVGVSLLWIGAVEVMGGLPIVIHTTDQTRLIRIFFHPELTAVMVCIALFTLIAMLAAVIPARRASRLSITDALRWLG